MELAEHLDDGERLARLALCLGVNGHPGAFHRVLRHAGTAARAFEGGDLGLPGVNLAPLLSAGLFEDARERLDSARDAGRRVILWGDPDYPLRLDEIVDPPPVLWIRGTLEPGDQFAVALVGSRQASPGGLTAARRLAREGARQGLTIVSGLAKGVDAQAHIGALEAGGRTLAVLGCGLDHVYPKENAALYERIARQGALISEFWPETSPLPVNFPRRNRIIAGLSLAVVVVEAGERSGALITARLALEQNREVMALPGPAGASFAKGAHRLIKDGAALVETMAEVLAEIKPRLLEGLTAPAPGNLPELKPMEEAAPPPALEAPAALAGRPPAKAARPAAAKPAAPPAPRPEPGTPAALILEALGSGPREVDLLIRGTGLSAAEVTVHLLGLEMDGLVSRLLSGQYALTVHT